jgi:metallophosphoesterase superfamily enzyme
MALKRFIATWDLHWGYERRGGHKVALHDVRALRVVQRFAEDFKPDVWIIGGDWLDCGAVSHHNAHKPRATEGMRLAEDAAECYKAAIAPIAASEKVFIIGNHEAWIEQLLDEHPGLEGVVSTEKLLHLESWKVIPQGGYFNLGKLTFIHGDTVSGGEHVAKAAVTNYERSVRFGHFHTHQTFTKNSALEYKHAKTGMAVPCLCTKAPKYGKGKPNKWVQGFLYGYIEDSGHYADYVALILNGRAIVNGKVYKG